jgi:ABC-type transport system involved in cytochrome c biogenesis permease subunit
MLDPFVIHLLLIKFSAAFTLPALGFLLLVKRRFVWAMLPVLFILSLQIAAIVLRVVIAQRAPITNTYETILWTGICVLGISWWIGFTAKQTLYVILGLMLDLACLLLLIFASSLFDPTIKPLTPVLRNNFWLITHVTIITTSYALLALSWVVANYVMVRQIWPAQKTIKTNIITTLHNLILGGVIFLVGGILLGAVWADMSWGRFWGWDPKETWSLISLLAYVIVLHGRYTKWIKPETFPVATALAFMTILMAWFGVNFVLTSGLHSYGFSEGGSLWLGALLLIQVLLFLMWLTRRQKALS